MEELSIARDKLLSKKTLKSLVVDRLGIQATRVQIEMLLEDIRERDVEVEMLRDAVDLWRNALENYRSKVQSDFTDLQSRFEIELDAQLTAQASVFDVKYRSLQEALRVAEVEMTNLRGQINHATPVLWSPRALLRKGSDPETTQKIVKVQSAIRGYVARAKVDRSKTYLSAMQSGVLIALKNTNQGNCVAYGRLRSLKVVVCLPD